MGNIQRKKNHEITWKLRKWLYSTLNSFVRSWNFRTFSTFVCLKNIFHFHLHNHSFKLNNKIKSNNFKTSKEASIVSFSSLDFLSIFYSVFFSFLPSKYYLISRLPIAMCVCECLFIFGMSSILNMYIYIDVNAFVMNYCCVCVSREWKCSEYTHESITSIILDWSHEMYSHAHTNHQTSKAVRREKRKV